MQEADKNSGEQSQNDRTEQKDSQNQNYHDNSYKVGQQALTEKIANEQQNSNSNDKAQLLFKQFAQEKQAQKSTITKQQEQKHYSPEKNESRIEQSQKYIEEQAQIQSNKKIEPAVVKQENFINSIEEAQSRQASLKEDLSLQQSPQSLTNQELENQSENIYGFGLPKNVRKNTNVLNEPTHKKSEHILDSEIFIFGIQNQKESKVINLLMKYINNQNINPDLTNLFHTHKRSTESQQKLAEFEKQKKLENQFWKELANIYQLQDSLITEKLKTNPLIIIKIFDLLSRLPMASNKDSLGRSEWIIKTLSMHFDPNRKFLQELLVPLVGYLQGSPVQLPTLNARLSFLYELFRSQTPTNENFDSYVELKSSSGFKLLESIKWPFQKGGTIVLWFRMSGDMKSKQNRLFSIENKQKNGFAIIMKQDNRIYLQRLQQQRSFRILKSKPLYLCDAVFDQYCKLSVEFQVKKRFMQYYSINVIMNNFALNNVEMDAISFNSPDFMIELFKNFSGKIYSVLVLTHHMAQQVEELNISRGFAYQNDIRNFTYIFQNDLNKVLLLYTAIRARTKVFQSIECVNSSIINNSESPKQTVTAISASVSLQEKYVCQTQTYLFDAVNRNHAKTKNGFVNRSNAIKKDMTNYGSLVSYVPFFQLLEKTAFGFFQQRSSFVKISMLDERELFSRITNKFFQVLKFIFLNKTQSIQEAYQINLFKIMARFFNRTHMIGFNDEIICSLREIYVALNTRMMRQKFFQQVVWNLKAHEYLSISSFNDFISFLRSFYIEDIQSALKVFGIQRIVIFLIENFELQNCCKQHARVPKVVEQKYPSHVNLLIRGHFNIIETILLLKRKDEDLAKSIGEILKIFVSCTSGCMLSQVSAFFLSLKQKDPAIFQQFFLLAMTQYKMVISVALAYCLAPKAKQIMTSLILQLYGEQMLRQFGKDKEFFMLCLRSQTSSYFQSINKLRSSIASRSQKDNNIADSVDLSQDKNSLNSIGGKKFILMDCLFPKLDYIHRINDPQLVMILSQWTFKSANLEKVGEDSESPGVYLLMELYKSAAYELRLQISEQLLKNRDSLKFVPDLLAWIVQCLVIAQIDQQDSRKIKCDETTVSLITKCKQNLLKIQAGFRLFQNSQENQLSIIKLVLTSVKAKYNQQRMLQYCNKVYLMISMSIVDSYTEIFQTILPLENQIVTGSGSGSGLSSSSANISSPSLTTGFSGTNRQSSKSFMTYKEDKHFQTVCHKFIENCYTFMTEYFNMRRDQEIQEIEQETTEIIEEEAQIVLKILRKILFNLILLTTSDEILAKNQEVLQSQSTLGKLYYLKQDETLLDMKKVQQMLQPKNTQKNQFIVKLLFSDKKDMSFLSLFMVILQTVFEFFQDFNVQWRKKVLNLIRDEVLFMIPILENSGQVVIESLDEQIKNIFLNDLGFLENKFHQYFYFSFENLKHLKFNTQNTIRNNINSLKDLIIRIVFDFIRTVKHVHDKSSLQHKSFYDLMKRNRKSNSKPGLKNYFPSCWKNADDKIIQYISLSTEILEKAREKMEMHLLGKKISLIATEIERKLAKKTQAFIAKEIKKNEGKEKMSIQNYIKNQSQKCKVYIEWEQKLSVLRFQFSQQVRNQTRKTKQLSRMRKRQTQNALGQIWNSNRVYQGLWRNPKFYEFSQQLQLGQYQNTLSIFYQRERSQRLSKYHLMPFIDIKPVSITEINSRNSLSSSQISLKPVQKVAVTKQELNKPKIQQQKNQINFNLNGGGYSKKSDEELSYINEMFLQREGDVNKSASGGNFQIQGSNFEKGKGQRLRKTEKYFKIGLRFLKQKVIEKIMKPPTQLSHHSSADSALQNSSSGQPPQGSTQVSYASVSQPSYCFSDVLWVKPMQVFLGHLKIKGESLQYCHKNSSSNEFQHLSLKKNKTLPKNQLLIHSWPLKNIQYFHLKKYMLRTNSVQIFIRGEQSLFFSFYCHSDYEGKMSSFEKFIDQLQSQLYVRRKSSGTIVDLIHLHQQNYQFNGFPNQTAIPRCLANTIDTFSLMVNMSKSYSDKVSNITEQWVSQKLSNFQYLMLLNLLSGRTAADLNQYFIFPWIFSNYDQIKRSRKISKAAKKKNALSNSSKLDRFRNMAKNMGSFGKNQRINKFKEIYKNIEENHRNQFPEPHFFGFHYSNLPVVLQFLIRMNPYTEGAKALQGGKFDLPDRLFYSIPDIFRNATNQMSDLRELIPEFFYFPQFLINSEKYQFGFQQNSKKVDNVELPQGSSNAYQFIQIHREELESQEVSQNIHKWIDLIFGYKQVGKQAQISMNKFHFLTYDHNWQHVHQFNSAEKIGNTSLSSEEETNSVKSSTDLRQRQKQRQRQTSFKNNRQQREAVESQIAYYGKTPTQIFFKPHPQRKVTRVSQQLKLNGGLSKSLKDNEGFKCSRVHPFNYFLNKIQNKVQQKKEDAKSPTKGKPSKHPVTQQDIFQMKQAEQLKEPLFLSKQCKNGKHILLRKNGQGIVFKIDRSSEKMMISILKSFQFDFTKFQNIYLLDERFYFNFQADRLRHKQRQMRASGIKQKMKEKQVKQVKENKEIKESREIKENKQRNQEQITNEKQKSQPEDDLQIIAQQIKRHNKIQEQILQKIPICSINCEYVIIGGLCGGKILKYSIQDEKSEIYGKHSETVSAVANSDILGTLVTGTTNGEIIIWQHGSNTQTVSINQNVKNSENKQIINNSNTQQAISMQSSLFTPNFKSIPSKRLKLIFKKKLAVHHNRITKITINQDLRVALSCGMDGLVSIIDLQSCQIKKVLKIPVFENQNLTLNFQTIVVNATIVQTPYYMCFVQTLNEQQFCFSLNGQLLERNILDQAKHVSSFSPSSSLREKYLFESLNLTKEDKQPMATTMSPRKGQKLQNQVKQKIQPKIASQQDKNELKQKQLITCPNLPGKVIHYDGSNIYSGKKHQQRILKKLGSKFQWVKLPDFSVQDQFCLKEPDCDSILDFVVTDNRGMSKQESEFSNGTQRQLNNILCVTKDCELIYIQHVYKGQIQSQEKREQHETIGNALESSLLDIRERSA